MSAVLPTVEDGRPLAPPSKSQLTGVNVLIEGPTGTGKTYSLGTLAETGLEVFIVFTESGLETLAGYFADRGKPIPQQYHWATVKPFSDSVNTLISGAEKVNSIALDAWSKMTDPGRGQYTQFITFLKLLTDFKDERTGQSYGPVDTWGTGRVLVIDSMTGLNTLVMALIVGAKPVKSLPEWGAAQEQMERLIRQLCDGFRCHFILLAHVDREVDQVVGGTKITISTLGVKLAPKLTPMFSDVILAKREIARFTWSTADQGADLKTRNLPIKEGVEANFVQIIEKWKSRGGIIETT